MHVSLESVIFFKYFCAEREGGRGGGKVSILQLKGDFKKNWIWIPKQKNKKNVTTFYYLPVHFTFMVDFDFNVYFTSNRTKSSKLCEAKQEGNLSTDMDGKRKYNSTSL